MKPDMPQNPKVLKISILGAPNVGKLTLVNLLINRRVNHCNFLIRAFQSFIAIFRLVQVQEK